MNNDNLFKITQNIFSFLEDDYGCELKKSVKEGWGFEVLYSNLTTGIKVQCEYREACLFIYLYKLIDGELIENPRNIRFDSELTGFDLNDVISLNNSSNIIKPFYSEFELNQDSETLIKLKTFRYILLFAESLYTYANEILRGDFKIFSKLDKIVKNRIES